MSKEIWSPERYNLYRAAGKKKTGDTSKGVKAKANMHWVLVDLSRRHDLILIQEYRFNQDRKWRADWALMGEKGERKIRIPVEYEGLGWGKTHHTDSKGYSKDTEKYTSAAILGWVVLRYTYLNYQNLSKDLEAILNNKL
jgi:hypothetical protein